MAGSERWEVVIMRVGGRKREVGGCCHESGWQEARGGRLVLKIGGRFAAKDRWEMIGCLSPSKNR